MKNIKYLIFIMVTILLSGCAKYDIDDDLNAESTGSSLIYETTTSKNIVIESSINDSDNYNTDYNFKTKPKILYYNNNKYIQLHVSEDFIAYKTDFGYKYYERYGCLDKNPDLDQKCEYSWKGNDNRWYYLCELETKELDRTICKDCFIGYFTLNNNKELHISNNETDILVYQNQSIIVLEKIKSYYPDYFSGFDLLNNDMVYFANYYSL